MRVDEFVAVSEAIGWTANDVRLHNNLGSTEFELPSVDGFIVPEPDSAFMALAGVLGVLGCARLAGVRREPS
jgi:hypothetical protein